MINYLYDDGQLLKYKRKERVFVIGGGASLRGVDLNCLKNEDIIAVNHSLYFLKDALFAITIDYEFFNSYTQYLREYQSKKAYKLYVASEINNFYKYSKNSIYSVNYSKEYTLLHLTNGVIMSNKFCPLSNTLKNKQFANGFNSGYCGLQLAYLLKYKKIYLLGMDLTKSKGYAQAYHKEHLRHEQEYKEVHKDYFDAFRNSLINYDKSQTEIVSCSSISLLNEFIKYKPLTEVL